MKNDSGISGEHNLSQANESLSPYLDGLCSVSQGLSPADSPGLSTKSINFGFTVHTIDNFIVIENPQKRRHTQISYYLQKRIIR
jgi:hypothetical protein